MNLGMGLREKLEKMCDISFEDQVGGEFAEEATENIWPKIGVPIRKEVEWEIGMEIWRELRGEVYEA